MIMLLKKSEIEVKIFEYKDKIKFYNQLLRKGHHNPSELRNAVIDYRVEIKKLEKLLEVC
jgi:hypothetical protein